MEKTLETGPQSFDHLPYGVNEIVAFRSEGIFKIALIDSHQSNGILEDFYISATPQDISEYFERIFDPPNFTTEFYFVAYAHFCR